MKRAIFCLMVVVSVVLLLLGACAKPAPTPAPAPTPTPAPTPAPAPAPKPVELKVLTCWPLTDDSSSGFKIWYNKVQERAKGALTFKYVGGPEAIPTGKQMEAARDGVVDVLLTVTGYYEQLFSEEAGSTTLTRITPWDERKVGYYDLLNKLHQEKLNVFYLGRVGFNVPFYLYTNAKVQTPYDMSGLKFRTLVVYDRFFKALGIVPVALSKEDIYTAVERRLVDGFGMTESGFTALGWQEVTKYIIDHPFYECNRLAFVNLKTWNGLSENLRKLMMDAMLETEHEAADYYAGVAAKERKKMLDAGMKTIKFASADAQWYVDLAYKVGWEKVMDKSPKYGPTFKEMLTK